MDVFDVELADVVHAAAHLRVFYHEEKKQIKRQVLITLSDLENHLKRRRDEDVQ
jgi:hypothetical protein